MAEFQTMRRTAAGVRTAEIDAGLRAHMNKVYGLMSVAMVVTGIVAWAIGMDLKAVVTAMQTGVMPDTLLPLGVIQAMFSSPLMYVIMFAPLGMVLFFGRAVNKMSAAGARLYFYVFSALMGLSIASIFAVYTGMSIAQTFFVTAAAFAGLSLWGYTTKKDISGWGAFLIMGLIGLIIASVVNLFLASAAMTFAISAIGVLIFAGLTAYDTQNIKNTYLQVRTQPNGEAIAEKMAIFGALSLYLDFINLFMFLLQFLGNRE